MHAGELVVEQTFTLESHLSSTAVRRPNPPYHPCPSAKPVVHHPLRLLSQAHHPLPTRPSRLRALARHNIAILALRTTPISNLKFQISNPPPLHLRNHPCPSAKSVVPQPDPPPMKRSRSRRSFLRGAGVSIAHPWMESLPPCSRTVTDNPRRSPAATSMVRPSAWKRRPQISNTITSTCRAGKTC